MHTIDIKKLEAVARLVCLLRPKAATDGENSHAKYSHLKLADGALTYSATDSELAFVSRFGVTGDGDTWEAAIRSGLVKSVFARLGRAAAEKDKKAQQRKAKIELRGEETLDLSRKSVAVCLPVARMVNPFPELEPPGDDLWTRIGKMELVNPLQFLAASPGRDDPNDLRQECTLFEDGVAMAAFTGKSLAEDGPDSGVMLSLVATGPELPFRVATTRHRAHRVLRWLELLPGEGPDRVQEIEIAEGAGGAAGYYFLRDADRAHILWFPSSHRAFPRENVDPKRAAPVTAGGILARSPLATTLALARREPATDALACTFKKRSGGWELELGAGAAGGLSVRNAIPVRMDPAPAEGVTEVRFHVKPATLSAALRRLRGRDVLLAYRETTALVSLRLFYADSLAEPGYQHPEVYFHSGRPAASQNADAEDEALPPAPAPAPTETGGTSDETST